MIRIPQIFSLSFGALGFDNPMILGDNRQNRPVTLPKEQPEAMEEVECLTNVQNTDQQRGPSEAP